MILDKNMILLILLFVHHIMMLVRCLSLILVVYLTLLLIVWGKSSYSAPEHMFDQAVDGRGGFSTPAEQGES